MLCLTSEPNWSDDTRGFEIVLTDSSTTPKTTYLADDMKMTRANPKHENIAISLQLDNVNHFANNVIIRRESQYSHMDLSRVVVIGEPCEDIILELDGTYTQ